MTKLRRGDKVKDRYGKVSEVRGQIGSTVYLADGNWIHRTKCWKLETFYSAELGRRVTIPED